MPVPAGQAYHVNGPALVLVGGQGLTGSLAALGLTEDGADITVRYYDAPIMTDAGGGSVPAELQDMGRDADISLRLPLYDDKVLRTILEKRAVLEGTDRAPGALIYQSGLGFRLVIDSPQEDPYRFLFCCIRGASSTKLGTRRTLWNLTVYAGRPVNVGGFKLFDRVKG